MASAVNISVQHQVSNLHFQYARTHGQHGKWYCQGKTTLYVITEDPPVIIQPPSPPSSTDGTSPAAQQQQHIALHLRGSCIVNDVKVESLNIIASSAGTKSSSGSTSSSPGTNKILRLLPSRANFQHIDPLQHVLIKPASTYNNNANSQDAGDDEIDNNGSKSYTFDADSQLIRGAVGMTTSLRAASMASNLGELRIAVTMPSIKKAIKTESEEEVLQKNEAAIHAWSTDLLAVSSSNTSTGKNRMNGFIQHELQMKLEKRSMERRLARIDLMARRMAIASGYPGVTKTSSNSESKAPQGTQPQQQLPNRAFKITIQYKIPLEDGFSIQHVGGLHVFTTNQTPHIYTTSVGIIGDHEGPRAWLPCCDSANVRNRATHCLSIKITAPAREGLSIVGCGEDYGVAQSILHEHVSMYNKGKTSSSGGEQDLAVLFQDQLGSDHVDFLQRVQREVLSQAVCNDDGDDITRGSSSKKRKRPHLIPVDEEIATTAPHLATTTEKSTQTTFVSLDSIYSTFIWCSHIWTPVPVRSLGFAIGPFKVLEDPEYFGPNAVEPDADDDDDDESESDNDSDTGRGKSSFESRLQAFLQGARSNGEGIRQVYFAPMFERKFLHTSSLSVVNISNSINNDIDNDVSSPSPSSLLLPNTQVQLKPLIAKQKELSEMLDHTVTFATTGVAHRALSLMRDVLALPTYRTGSYTQIWIPNAVHGGITSGALHNCPECLINPFLGGSIMDSRLLPPSNCRLPFYHGGRVLQFTQARNAVRGWIIAALPIGGNDDVGVGYLLTLIESFLMSLYERGHGGFGEGGAKGSMFYSKRYAASSGLNSTNLDFLPVQNIEEIDVSIGGLGAVPVEDRHNEQLWRGANNGSESHTSAMDEFNVRQVLCKDAVEALERLTDKDKDVPSPSMGWFGSHLSLTFLSSNATSSSDVGCGAVDLVHPIGGLVYRGLKCDLLRGVVEGRAGIAAFIRLVRATFVAAHLQDLGEKELKLPKSKKKQEKIILKDQAVSTEVEDDVAQPQPPFVICVNEILKKEGLQHTLFTRVLQNLAGRIREPHLLGTLVDVERHAEDPRTRRPFVDPEGFPNSYVRGASLFYLKVGVLVEASRDSASQIAKGIQMQAYAEPVVPKGGVAFGGPITIRVVENEGSFREYVKDVVADGSRRDWGVTFLHAKPVTTAKAQTAASGAIESSKDTSKAQNVLRAKASTLGAPVVSSAFTETNFHSGGYQAIELIRLTNLTPLLWVRVDPMGLYGGRICVVQPDACLAEQLFHDGDAGAQVDAIRALAERPLRIQGTLKVTTVYDVNVSELPVRILGDCFRGSPALHSSLPHTPVVRCQAALASAIWQNNKAPPSKDSVGADNWVGINILIHYFRERFYSNSVIMPVKFSRLVMKKSDVESRQTATNSEGAALTAAQPTYDATYQYLDSLDQGEEIADALEEAESVEFEEDEEYRVRSAVTTAIASIRAKDGMTPPLALQFLETVLESEDAEMVSNLIYPDEELMVEKTRRKLKSNKDGDSEIVSEQDEEDRPPSSRSYVSSVLVADALLALCHVNSMPAIITDPATGKPVQSTGTHPLSRLLKASKSWLEWELYREKIRMEQELETRSGIGGSCYDVAAACAITGLSNLCISIKSSTESECKRGGGTSANIKLEDNRSLRGDHGEADVSSARYYLDIFDSRPHRNDFTRAACAQAIACICCAADRIEEESVQPVGLLCALEFMLERIVDPETSPGLRHTMALVMMDACTGKVCSMQRVGSIAGRNDLITAANRFMNGPLGSGHGGDNGSALLMSVSAASFPAASAVNDGARRGLPLLMKAGHPKAESMNEVLVVRVALFATRLWRTINGEPADPPKETNSASYNMGVCAYDGILRCSLLALWQWIWPKGCYAVLQVQAWKSLEKTQLYRDMGAHHVMKISDQEKAAASEEEKLLSEINRFVQIELDRQIWRGEMAGKAYDLYRASKGAAPVADVAAAEQGIGQPLPPIERDQSFKQGGWIASAAQQRRALALDGGTAVTKVRLTVKSSS